MSRTFLRIGIYLTSHLSRSPWDQLLEHAKECTAAPGANQSWIHLIEPDLPTDSLTHRVLCIDSFQNLPVGLSLPEALKRFDALISTEHPLLSPLPAELLQPVLAKTFQLADQSSATSPVEPSPNAPLLCLLDKTLPHPFAKAEHLFQSLSDLPSRTVAIRRLEPNCADSFEPKDAAGILLATRQPNQLARISHVAAERGIPLLVFSDSIGLESCQRLQACFGFSSVSVESTLSAIGKATQSFIDKLPCLRSRASALADALAPSGVIHRLHAVLLGNGNDIPTPTPLDTLRTVSIPRFAFLPTPEEQRDAALDLPFQPEQAPADRLAQFAVIASQQPSPEFHYEETFVERCARSFLAELLYQRHGVHITGVSLYCCRNFARWTDWSRKLLESESRSDRAYAALIANRHSENATLLPSSQVELRATELAAAINATQCGRRAYHAGQGSARNLESLTHWLKADGTAAQHCVSKDYQSHPLARDRAFETATLGPRRDNDLNSSLELMEYDWKQRRLSSPAAVAYLSLLFRSGSTDNALAKLEQFYRDNPDLRGLGGQIALHLANDFSQSLECVDAPSRELKNAHSKANQLLDLDRQLDRCNHDSVIAELIWAPEQCDVEDWLESATPSFPQFNERFLNAAFRSLGVRLDLTTAQAIHKRYLEGDSQLACLAWSEFLAATLRSRRLPFAPLSVADRPLFETAGQTVELLCPPKTRSVPLINCLAYLRISLSDTDEAENLFRQALARYDSNLIRFSRLALYSWSLGHDKAARCLLSQDRPTLACPPGDLFLFSISQAVLGNTEKATATYQQARLLAPQLFNLDSPLPATILLWLSLLAHALGDQAGSDRYATLYTASESGYRATAETAFLHSARSRVSVPEPQSVQIDFSVQLPASALSRS